MADQDKTSVQDSSRKPVLKYNRTGSGGLVSLLKVTKESGILKKSDQRAKSGDRTGNQNQFVPPRRNESAPVFLSNQTSYPNGTHDPHALSNGGRKVPMIPPKKPHKSDSSVPKDYPKPRPRSRTARSESYSHSIQRDSLLSEGSSITFSPRPSPGRGEEEEEDVESCFGSEVSAGVTSAPKRPLLPPSLKSPSTKSPSLKSPTPLSPPTSPPYSASTLSTSPESGSKVNITPNPPLSLPSNSSRQNEDMDTEEGRVEEEEEEREEEEEGEESVGEESGGASEQKSDTDTCPLTAEEGTPLLQQKRLDSASSCSSAPSNPRLPSHSGTEVFDVEPRPSVQELKFENEVLQHQVKHLKKQRSDLQEENKLLVHKLTASGSHSGESSQASPARSASPTSLDAGLTGFASDLMSSLSHLSSSGSSSTPPPRPPPKPVPPVTSAPAITANQKVSSHSAPVPRQPLASQTSSTTPRYPTAGDHPEEERGEEERNEEGRGRIDSKQLARMQLGRFIERAKAHSPDSAAHSTVTASQSGTHPVPSQAPPLSASSDTPVPPIPMRTGVEEGRVEVDGGGDGVRGEGGRRVWGGGEGKEASQPPRKPQRILRAESRDEGREGKGTTRDDKSSTKADQGETTRPECGPGSSVGSTVTRDDRRRTHPSETEKPVQPVSTAGTNRFTRVSSGSSAVSEIAKHFLSQEGETGKPSLSSMSESDEVFVSRERSGAMIEPTPSPLPRETATESQSSVGMETKSAPGVYAKKTAIKSDQSWIRRRISLEDAESDGSSVFTQSQPLNPPSPTPVRPARPPPYRSHGIISTASPTPQPARPPYPHTVKSSHSQPSLPGTTYQVRVHQSTRPAQPPIKAHSKTTSQPELQPSRGRVGSASEKKRGKSGGRGGERNGSLTRSASEESLSNVLKRSGEKVAPATSKGGKKTPPKRPARPWAKNKELTADEGQRPSSMILMENESPPRFRAWGGGTQEEEEEFTVSCVVPNGSSPVDKSKHRPKRTTEPHPLAKKGSIFGRRKGKHKEKEQPQRAAPPLEEAEEDEGSDSSSEDEKGGTIKFKPKLRPVSVRRASSVEDDFDSTYPQLFERVFVVGLKMDPVSKKLVTEVTYTFPPRPPSERVRDETMEAIPQFCFPDIDHWKPTTRYQSETFSFVLTNIEGHRRFGYCRRLLPSGSGPRLPEVTCLVSPLGCFSLYEKILDHIEARRQVSTSAVFTFLKAIVANPFPKPGRSVQVRAFSATGGGMETVTLNRPMDSRLEHVDFSILFSTLSIRKIIQLFSSMLMERRIILCANNLSLLTGCAHALLALLYPFEWQHVFIPVLPNSLIEFCCSPLPYMIGINPSLIRSLDTMDMEEALVVDLDKKKFSKKIGDETSILPSKLFQYLEHSLGSSVIAAEYQKHPSKRTTASRADEIVINTFLTFFVYLYGDYKSYMKSTTGNDKEFQRKDYERKFSSKSTRRFLEAFHMTQMFENFIEPRECASKAEMVDQSTFEKHNIPELRERCTEIEIFSSKSKISRWRMRKGIGRGK